MHDVTYLQVLGLEISSRQALIDTIHERALQLASCDLLNKDKIVLTCDEMMSKQERLVGQGGGNGHVLTTLIYLPVC